MVNTYLWSTLEVLEILLCIGQMCDSCHNENGGYNQIQRRWISYDKIRNIYENRKKNNAIEP